MGIGLGVVLLLVGLVLALDVVNLPASIDDLVATNTLGWILIIVGALASLSNPRSAWSRWPVTLFAYRCGRVAVRCAP